MKNGPRPPRRKAPRDRSRVQTESKTRRKSHLSVFPRLNTQELRPRSPKPKGQSPKPTDQSPTFQTLVLPDPRHSLHALRCVFQHARFGQHNFMGHCNQLKARLLNIESMAESEQTARKIYQSLGERCTAGRDYRSVSGWKSVGLGDPLESRESVTLRGTGGISKPRYVVRLVRQACDHNRSGGNARSTRLRPTTRLAF